MTETDIKQDDENMEDGAVGIIWTRVYNFHRGYQSRAREAGKVVLEIEDFWNKFRRRYPGSWEGHAEFGPDDEKNLGRAVFVGLRATDTALAAKIGDGFFTSDGQNGVLDAFIQEQDTLSGEPLEDDFIDDTIPF
jgi:hypothetical protein